MYLLVNGFWLCTFFVCCRRVLFQCVGVRRPGRSGIDVKDSSCLSQFVWWWRWLKLNVALTFSLVQNYIHFYIRKNVLWTIILWGWSYCEGDDHGPMKRKDVPPWMMDRLRSHSHVFFVPDTGVEWQFLHSPKPLQTMSVTSSFQTDHANFLLLWHKGLVKKCHHGACQCICELFHQLGWGKSTQRGKRWMTMYMHAIGKIVESCSQRSSNCCQLIIHSAATDLLRRIYPPAWA
jgi:hypothetical protein